MSKKPHGGKPPHKWTGYFYISDEKRNKTYKTAKCLACINANDPSLIVEEMNNKREKCRNYLRDCSRFKAQFNEEEWASIYASILQEQEDDRQKRLKKARHSKKRLREDYDDNQDVTSLVSTLPSINSTRSLSTQSTQPTFTDTQPSNDSILFYMPRRLTTESTKHWYNLVLRATVSCGWPFRWVENEEAREMINFANSALPLPSRKNLARNILEDTVKDIKLSLESIAQSEKIGLTVAFDGWKNVVKQSILGTVIITSSGRSIVWEAKDISAERSRSEEAINQIETWLDENKKKGLKIICIVTDSAGAYTAARSYLRQKHRELLFLPCFAHQVNLVVGEIFKESSDYREVSAKAIELVSFFNTSSYFLGKFREEQKSIYDKVIALQHPCVTRWNSHYICFNSLVKTEIALKILVTKYENLSTRDKPLKASICNIIKDDGFWSNLTILRDHLIPLCNALDKLQRDAAKLYEVLHYFGYFYKLYNRHDNVEFSRKMIDRLERRWAQWEQPLLLLSFWLHPIYRETSINQNVHSKVSHYIKGWLIYYYKVWFEKEPQRILLEFEDYNEQEFPYQATVYNQFQGDVLKYWNSIGKDGSELALVACRIFGVCINSASVERLFSSMKNIHNPSRNRLKV